jgi:hypothetical protein
METDLKGFGGEGGGENIQKIYGEIGVGWVVTPDKGR